MGHFTLKRISRRIADEIDVWCISAKNKATVTSTTTEGSISLGHLFVGVGMDSIKAHWRKCGLFDNGRIPLATCTVEDAEGGMALDRRRMDRSSYCLGGAEWLSRIFRG